MSCSIDLLAAMDLACEKSQFPIWDCNEDYAFTGAMRVSGVTTAKGVGLVFEVIEYNVPEGGIQSVAYCISTFPTKTWRHFGNGIYIPDTDIRHVDTGEVSLGFSDVLKVTSRNQVSEILLEKNDLVLANPLNLESDKLVILSLLFKICDTLPRDYLFSTQDYLRDTFGFPSDVKTVFVMDEWEHPSIEIYEEEATPSSYPDITALAQAVCVGNAIPELKGISNTSWRRQWPIINN